MGKNIVVIGSMNQDIIMKISRMPELGESMMVDECILAAGGKGSNQAVQAAKLGADVSMIGSVGNDAMGEFLLSEAEKFRVNVTNVAVVIYVASVKRCCECCLSELLSSAVYDDARPYPGVQRQVDQ